MYQILGFTVNSIAKKATIKLINPLITNARSIAACTNPRGPKMEETPAFIFSTHPIHKCVFTPEEARRLNTMSVGVSQTLRHGAA